MRYYSISITNPDTGAAITPTSLGSLGLTSLLPDGTTNPCALDVFFDLPVADFTAKQGNAIVRVWGLGLQQVVQSFNLGAQAASSGQPYQNGANITIQAGMAKGLPLAKPSQQGLLIKGQIFQAFGNWLGVEQTVDLIITAGYSGTGTPDQPKNIVFNWPASQSLTNVVQTTLATAFPNVQIKVSLSTNLVLPNSEQGYYDSLDTFAEMVKRLSLMINKTAGYPGISIAYKGDVITVSDGSSPSAAKQLAFEDMIGQPTWIEPQTIQVKLVMRGDLNLNDVVTLPSSLATTTQQSYLRLQDTSTFTGNYVISDVHHYGHFRQPDAESWNTTINMYPETKAAE